MSAPRQLSNLGLALQERYDQLGDLADLERAIAHYEQAVTLTRSSPDLPDYLNHLGLGLRERYERMGCSRIWSGPSRRTSKRSERPRSCLRTR